MKIELINFADRVRGKKNLEIVQEIVTAINTNVYEVGPLLNALKHIAPDDRNKVCNILEDWMIGEAMRIGMAYRKKGLAAIESDCKGDQPQGLAAAFRIISERDQVRPFTRLLAAEYAKLSPPKRPTNKLIACFARATINLEREVEAAKKAAEVAQKEARKEAQVLLDANRTAATTQQKLNKFAAQREFRIIGKSNKTPGL